MSAIANLDERTQARYKEQCELLPISDDDLILQRAYSWEARQGDQVFLTQPMGKGVVREYTWKQMLDESRRMATYLKSLNYPAGSQIATGGSAMTPWFHMSVTMMGFH